jgi:rSAM/selenodomain-associated transferase 1
MYTYPDAVIMVFCKAPIPGHVKTRMIPPLTGEEAAQLHRELVQRALQLATQNQLCEVQLWGTLPIDHPFFVTLTKTYPVDRYLQQGADLGERMHHALSQALARFSSAVIIGCDCPSLTSDDLDRALSQLSQGKPCVLAPAEDGGYVLIGLKQSQPSLFDNIPWGTEEVLALTRAKLQSLGLDYHQLNTQWDLDTPDDLRRYRGEAMERD